MNIFLFHFFFFLLFYVSWCETVDSKCTYPSYNVIHNGMNWVSSIEGETYEVKDDNGTYLYSIGICVTPNISKQAINLLYAAVIQTNLKVKNSDVFVLGRFNNTDIKMGNNWGVLEFKSGDYYGSHCGSTQRMAMIMITCNENIKKPILRIVEENNQKKGNCYYLFELEHPKMCSVGPTSVKSNSLGVGSILVIVIVFLIFTYFGLGMTYKKIFYNARGKEIIPNIRLWRCIGELFSNCVEKVCRPRPLDIDYDTYQPVQRGNLTINDLEPDEVEDDDCLLP